jgi:uncharacterized protein YcfL
MRLTYILVPLTALLLTGCGTTEKTVVVQAPPGSTVVVPPHGDAKVVPQGQ